MSRLKLNRNDFMKNYASIIQDFNEVITASRAGNPVFVDIGSLPFPGFDRFGDYVRLATPVTFSIEAQGSFETFSSRGEFHAIPQLVADGRNQNFYRTYFPACSSILEPNLSVAKHFSGLCQMLEVVEKAILPSTRLDDIIPRLPVTLMKLDCQGAERLILENGLDTLERTSVLFIEVSFYELYKNQPLQSAIFDFLWSKGFYFVGFDDFKTNVFHVNWREPGSGGVQTSADAVFIRNLDHLKAANLEVLLDTLQAIMITTQNINLMKLLCRIIDERENFKNQYLLQLYKYLDVSI